MNHCFRLTAFAFNLAFPWNAFAQTTAPAPVPVSPISSNYHALQTQVEANLRTHVLNQWFPRAVNTKTGGFDQNFSENWTNTSNGERSIVYQSRLTWLAGQAALRYPKEAARWKAASTHGADFLRTAMWDAPNGGFFWALENGVPVRNGEKHVYGNAFAIYALAANYRATKDPRALSLAQSAFRWLDLHAHDAKNGGYFEALDRTGRPILAPLSEAQSFDVIGTRYGFKSMNSHIHLLEALAALHEVWPDKAVEARLREVFGVVRDTIVVPNVGAMNVFFTPGWKPVPYDDSYGHDIETAYLLVEAAGALGMPDDAQTWKTARQLVDHTLEFGHDAENGGFYDAGGAFGGVSKSEKVWWTQAEALNALLLMHKKYGAQTPRYFDAFNRQWNFIRTQQTDAKNGGWYSVLTKEGATTPDHAKSDGWTEGYHQGRALLNVSAMLQQLAAK
ncbi:AGE family epimerase/isomerase [Abditibacterium utsteinense]|nr:AGE family epimerase/isomerase [Abditibacterium utsteinense]